MKSAAAGVSSDVLRWAREAQGLSVDEVARFLKRDPEEIAAWELGSSTPTYVQLERLAYGLFKRPVAVFYLPQPPQEPEPRQEFRSLPDSDLDALARDTRQHLRLAKAYQLSLYDIYDGENPADRLIFHDVAATPQQPPQVVAATVREYLGVSIADQVGWKRTDVALRHWRHAVEGVGVFVFKNSLKQKAISAFALYDDNFPLIYLNNSTAHSRQIFSLFHELGHVLLHANSISTSNDSTVIDKLPLEQQSVEVFCNAFASNVLVPQADFSALVPTEFSPTAAWLESVASRYAVSREVVIRRLLESGRITRSEYLSMSESLTSFEVARKPEEGGGNYYYTQANYLSQAFATSVLKGYYRGSVSLDQASELLGVKASSFHGLENALLRGRGAE